MTKEAQMEKNLKWHDENGKMTPLYRKWTGARSRCYNKDNPRYPLYGGRGIRMCDDWLLSFRTFAEWAYKNGYAEGKSLDRVDNYLGYSPDNCRWVDPDEQKRNRRYCYHFKYRGRQFATLEDAAKFAGLKQNTLTRRLMRGWPVELAMETPAGGGYRIRSSVLKTKRRKFDKCAFCATPPRSGISRKPKSSRR